MPAKYLIVLGAPQSRLAPDGQSVLARQDVEVVEAISQRMLRAAVESRRPDLIIVGSDFPDGPVSELCSAIRERKDLRQPSILLVASAAERGRIDAITRAGATAVLLKPIEPAAFDEAVGRLLTVPTRRSFRVLVRVATSSQGLSFGESRNLSANGMLLESGGLFAVGDRLNLRFFLPGDKTDIQVQAEIVRGASVAGGSREWGLRFVEVAPEAEAAIARFVESRARRTESM